MTVGAKERAADYINNRGVRVIVGDSEFMETTLWIKKVKLTVDWLDRM